jgi:hypothetical protein
MHGKEIYNDDGSAGSPVIAEVEGWRILSLGEIEYQYPVVVARELHLW